MFLAFQMTKGESSDEYVLGEPTAADESRAVKKRNRVLQSCIPCHELRRKCDRKRPCTRCVDHGVGGQCVYQLEDPAARQGPNQDELVRLRKRVAELERTVRVLMQRPLRGGSAEAMPEGIDENMLASLGMLPNSANDGDDSRRKKGRVSPSDDSGHSVYPGYSTGTSNDNYGKLPLPHCGCASSPDGQKLYAQLQTSMGDALMKLGGLSNHQRQGTFCQLFSSLSDLLGSVKTAAQTKTGSPPQVSIATPSPISPFGPHPTFHHSHIHTHSHSSTSPPQQDPGISLPYSAIPGYDTSSIPQQQSYPYSYSSRHASSLSHTSPQQTLSASPPHTMTAMSSVGYQQTLSHHQLGSSSMGLPGHAPTTAQPSGFTSTLSSWDAMAGPSSPPPKVRPTSSSTRGSKHASRSPYDPRFGK